MNELTERESAIRAAAIIDTDGSIFADRRGTGSIRLSVTSTDMRLLDWLYGTYGGHIRNHSTARDGYMHKQTFHWELHGRDSLVPFLSAIRPFLLIKTDQARLALEFLSMVGGRGDALSNENRQRRSELAAALSVFNHSSVSESAHVHQA